MWTVQFSGSPRGQSQVFLFSIVNPQSASHMPSPAIGCSENTLRILLGSVSNRTDWLDTTCGIVLIEKLIFAQLVKKFPAFYGTRKFITVLTRAWHRSLSWAIWFQYTTSHAISLTFTLILPLHLLIGDSKRSLLSKFLNEKLCTFFTSSPFVLRVPSSFNHPNNIIEDYKYWSPSLCNFV
jgi:hypothetical protein